MLGVSFLIKLQAISSVTLLKETPTQIFSLNVCDREKQIYPKKQKKEILRRDTLRISVGAVRRCAVKKVSLKNSPPVYEHSIKLDIK